MEIAAASAGGRTSYPRTEIPRGETMKLFGYFACGLSSVAVVVALLSGIDAIPSAGADRHDGRVVALSYDSGTATLLKAYARTLYRSTDGGQNWQNIDLPASAKGQISSLAVSPVSKGVMYVAGSSLGVFRTDDAGKTWVELNEGLASRDVVAVAAHTTQPKTLYVLLKEHGFYRSQDGGKSWRLMERKSQEGLRQLIHSDLPGSMQTGWLFAATSKGVRRVMDCFCLWQNAGKLESQALSVTYDPRAPKHIYTATEKGLFRSADGGENWVHLNSPGSEIVSLAFARSGILFAINADGGLYRSEDQGDSWKQVYA